jgi:histone H3/H4
LREGDQKIRIAGDAKDKVAEYLDKAVEAAVKEIISKLPRKSKGEGKGSLKRITIQAEDFK